MASCSMLMNHFCLTDMVFNMKAAVNLDSELTVEEENLLTVAYNNAVGARRASWRIVSSIEQKEKQLEYHSNTKLPLIKTYREYVSAQGPVFRH